MEIMETAKCLEHKFGVVGIFSLISLFSTVGAEGMAYGSHAMLSYIK